MGYFFWSMNFSSEAEVVFASEEEAARIREMGMHRDEVDNKLLSNPFKERLHFAQSGDVVSQYLVGESYLYGSGVQQNDAEALKWYLSAAEQGHVDAQSEVGRMFFMGEGIARNNEEAYFWYRLASNAGKPQKLSESVARYLKPDQIAAVEKRVTQWTPTGRK